MTAMFSGEGERVPFKTSSLPRGLRRVLDDGHPLRDEGHRAGADRALARPTTGDAARRVGAQVARAGDHRGLTLFWTKEVEPSISTGGNAGLHDYLPRSHEQLMELTRIVAGKITKLQRKSLGALITIDVHARDVIGDHARQRA